jgi:hypothetical protein
VARAYMEIPNAMVIPKFLTLNKIRLYLMAAISVLIKVSHFVTIPYGSNMCID